MKKQLGMVKDFHKKFGSPVLKEPSLIGLDRAFFRFTIMLEELNEYKKGVEKGNLENISKELADLLYTVLGTIHEHGLSSIIEEVFYRTHKSNMSKDLSPDHRKAVKGEKYFEANLANLFIKTLNK